MRGIKIVSLLSYIILKKNPFIIFDAIYVCMSTKYMSHSMTI